MVKAITRSNEQAIEELITKKLASTNDKLDEIVSKIEFKRKEENVADIIAKMKNKIPEKVIKPELPKPPVQDVIISPVKEHDHDDVFCPTCTKGHVHKMDKDGLTMKCAYGKCGKEFVIVPKDANAKCETCGIPLQTPSSDKILDACPFCGGKKAKMFDFSKLIVKNKV